MCVISIYLTKSSKEFPHQDSNEQTSTPGQEALLLVPLAFQVSVLDAERSSLVPISGWKGSGWLQPSQIPSFPHSPVLQADCCWKCCLPCPAHIQYLPFLIGNEPGYLMLACSELNVLNSLMHNKDLHNTGFIFGNWTGLWSAEQADQQSSRRFAVQWGDCFGTLCP